MCVYARVHSIKHSEDHCRWIDLRLQFLCFLKHLVLQVVQVPVYVDTDTVYLLSSTRYMYKKNKNTQ